MEDRQKQPNGYDTIMQLESYQEGSPVPQRQLVTQFIQRVEAIETFLQSKYSDFQELNFGNAESPKKKFFPTTQHADCPQQISALKLDFESQIKSLSDKIEQKLSKLREKQKKQNDKLYELTDDLRTQREDLLEKIGQCDLSADIQFIHEQLSNVKDLISETSLSNQKNSQSLFDQLEKKQRTTASQLATLILQFKELPNNTSSSNLNNSGSIETHPYTMYQDIQSLKITVESLRRPLVTEMNNLRKENENMGREIARMMGQMRDTTVQNLAIQKQLNQQATFLQDITPPQQQSPRNVGNSPNVQQQFISTQFSPGRTLFGHKSTLSSKKTTIATTEPLRASVLQPLQQRGSGVVNQSVNISKTDYRNASTIYGSKHHTELGATKLSNLAILQSMGSSATPHSIRDKNRSIDFGAQKNYDSFKGTVNATSRATGAALIMPLERFEQILSKNEHSLNHSPSTRKHL
ncbi:hypothetical protein FGO68_gene4385 [Halteria grandinella]|uniref:Uncharacterized protein n=1 Tax=Halteria grandinella TaxID=5974 RepID=A0A8J8SWK1_HALGN|nr:hypothetical protein FGO68_gene4385 [Halteria grandinella]